MHVSTENSNKSSIHIYTKKHIYQKYTHKKHIYQKYTHRNRMNYTFIYVWMDVVIGEDGVIVNIMYLKRVLKGIDLF